MKKPLIDKDKKEPLTSQVKEVRRLKRLMQGRRRKRPGSKD